MTDEQTRTEVTKREALLVEYLACPEDDVIGDQVGKPFKDAVYRLTQASAVNGAAAQRESDVRVGHQAAFHYLNMQSSQREYSWHDVEDALTKGSEAIRANPLPTELANYVARQRLEEARWWEHLVGNIKPDHSENYETDCMYCQRIAELTRNEFLIDQSADIVRLTAERDNFKTLFEDLCEGMDVYDCLPECDSYSHAENCPYVSPLAAWNKLRAERDELKKALVVAALPLEVLRVELERGHGTYLTDELAEAVLEGVDAIHAVLGHEKAKPNANPLPTEYEDYVTQMRLEEAKWWQTFTERRSPDAPEAVERIAELTRKVEAGRVPKDGDR